MQKLILAIDTSCDDTSAAVTQERRILSNVVSSQENLHKQYGGVMPALAKLEHAKRIQPVIELALKRAKINLDQLSAIAVTQGPGLAIALEVGIAKAQELAKKINKPLIAVNHMEGHLLSSFAQNSLGNKSSIFEENANYLGLLISGGHTEFIHFSEIGKYEKIGQTLDDACGESFDKSARLLGLGYPGGAVLGRMANSVRADYKVEVKRDSRSQYVQIFPKSASKVSKMLAKAGLELILPVPMAYSGDLNFSFSGLKTAFWQLVQKFSQFENQDKDHDFAQERAEGVKLSPDLTAALSLLFETTAIESLATKLELALQKYQVDGVLLGGGVVNSAQVRKRLKQVCRKHKVKLHYPFDRKLFIDNAAMIGVAAGYRLNSQVKSSPTIDRKPNWSITEV